MTLLEYNMTDEVSTQLEPYRNRNRVLLIFAPSPANKAYLEQKRLLERAEDGLQERDVVVLELLEGEQARALRDDFSVSENVFAVVLIGKDGGEKERFLEPAQPGTLFNIIDQMPMRRREMEAEE